MKQEAGTQGAGHGGGGGASLSGHSKGCGRGRTGAEMRTLQEQQSTQWVARPVGAHLGQNCILLITEALALILVLILGQPYDIMSLISTK